MPLLLRLTDLSIPQGWIIPDSSPGVDSIPGSGSDGLMSKQQAQELAKLAAGSQGAGVWQQPTFVNGFGDSVEGLPLAVGRLVGVQVQLAGAIQAPDAGAAANLPIGVMPTDLIPTVPRVIAVQWSLGATMGEANLIIDSGAIFVPPFPPGIIAVGGVALPAAGGGNHVQLLIEGLSYFTNSTPGT